MVYKKPLLERLMTAADLPGENALRLPLVEIIGDRRVIIENHCGIVQYCRDIICVKVKNGEICVCGRGLVLSHMSKEQMIIGGYIDSVSLSRGKQK